MIAPLDHHNDLYFPDGNLVLITDRKAFRVHSGILARHSEVFRDMLTVAGSAESEERYDGTPVVHMIDAAEDLELLLKMLYDGCKRCILSLYLLRVG